MCALCTVPTRHESGGGGGVLQVSASDATLVTLLVARRLAIERYRSKHPEVSMLPARILVCSARLSDILDYDHEYSSESRVSLCDSAITLSNSYNLVNKILL